MRERATGIASRAVQVGLVIVLIVLWYLGDDALGRQPHPAAKSGQRSVTNSVDVLRIGEFICRPRVTLIELAVAFAISTTAGITLGYLISRSAYAIRVFEPLLRRHLFDPDHPVPAALSCCSSGSGRRRRSRSARPSASFRSCSTPSRASAMSTRSSSPRRARWARPIIQLFRWVLLPAAFPVMLDRPAHGLHRRAPGDPRQRDARLARRARPPHRHLAEGMEMARMFAYIVFVVAIAAAPQRRGLAARSAGQALMPP